MEDSKEDKGPFNLPEDGPPTLSDAVSKTREEKRKDHTSIIHGTMIWNGAISLMNWGRPINRCTYYSENNESDLIVPDVVYEDDHCIAGDAINPHSNRHDGEKCCQL